MRGAGQTALVNMESGTKGEMEEGTELVQAERGAVGWKVAIRRCAPFTIPPGWYPKINPEINISPSYFLNKTNSWMREPWNTTLFKTKFVIVWYAWNELIRRKSKKWENVNFPGPHFSFTLTFRRENPHYTRSLHGNWYGGWGRTLIGWRYNQLESRGSSCTVFRNKISKRISCFSWATHVNQMATFWRSCPGGATRFQFTVYWKKKNTMTSNREDLMYP